MEDSTISGFDCKLSKILNLHIVQNVIIVTEMVCINQMDHFKEFQKQGTSKIGSNICKARMVANIYISGKKQIL